MIIIAALCKIRFVCNRKEWLQMDNRQIGRFIAACRKEKGLTQRELGERLHVTDRAVSKWETGVSHS